MYVCALMLCSGLFVLRVVDYNVIMLILLECESSFCRHVSRDSCELGGRDWLATGPGLLLSTARHLYTITFPNMYNILQNLILMCDKEWSVMVCVCEVERWGSYVSQPEQPLQPQWTHSTIFPCRKDIIWVGLTDTVAERINVKCGIDLNTHRF